MYSIKLSAKQSEKNGRAPILNKTNISFVKIKMYLICSFIINPNTEHGHISWIDYSNKIKSKIILNLIDRLNKTKCQSTSCLGYFCFVLNKIYIYIYISY